MPNTKNKTTYSEEYEDWGQRDKAGLPTGYCKTLRRMRTSEWPASKLASYKIGRATEIKFARWQHVASALDYFTGGNWSNHVTLLHLDKECAVVSVAVTVHCEHGDHTRTSVTSVKHKDIHASMGSAEMSAERKAFKRACALFGIADRLEDDGNVATAKRTTTRTNRRSR